MSDPGIAEPSFPPLLHGAAADRPFETAVARAHAGTEPGLVAYDARPDRLTAALVLAPEVPLGEAMAMVLAAANGFADAFGALAPAEVACQFDWPGGIRINGGRCGGLMAAAATPEPGVVPGWLVVGLTVPFQGAGSAEPGDTPDKTTLDEEGCGGIAPVALLESWSRHTLVWIHEWLDAGPARLTRDWLGRAYGLGAETRVTLPSGVCQGIFRGMDKSGGLILEIAGERRGYPLTLMLEPEVKP